MLITLIGRLVQFALMFASVRIMTQLLSPADMGRVALITTATALFALFLVNPVGMFFNRRLHAWVQQGVARVRFHLYLVYLAGVCLFASGALWVAARLGVDIGGASLTWAAILICGSIFFSTMVQTLVPSLNMVGRPRAFIALTLGTLVTGLVASVLLIHFTGQSAEHWLTGILLAQVLFSLVSYRVFFGARTAKTHEPSPLTADKLRQMAKFCGPIAIAVLLQWAHMQGYRFLLAERFGLAQLGLYAAGYGLAASLMSAAETILTTWFQPQFYRDVNAEDPLRRDRAWATYASVLIPASLLAVTALIAAAPSLPRVMLGPAFHGVSDFVVLGALAEWARMMVGMIGLNAHRHMATRALIVPNILGALATYAAFYALAHTIGMAAAPLAVFLGGLSIVAFLYGVTYAGDAHMTIDFPRLLPATATMAACAALAYASQTWLDLSQRSVPLLACLGIGAVWSLLAWRLLKPSFMNRAQHP
ncbi:lipopolysaccharide biosynthesis protein [Roseateles sp. BYS78W]|uniref:Lipopolysaccharide biosynthesis protein n=1 Tax=Pelomonas candidula TaxID=3299025 RepID=A0ABW7HA39_9BURK